LNNTWLDPLSPLVTELERYALWVNTQWRLGLVTPCTLVVQTKGKKAEYGHFRQRGWEHGAQAVHEISIAAEELRRKPLDVLATVHHEMIHAANHEAGVQDCAKAGRHNKRYKTTAEGAGLSCGLLSKARGWADTALLPETVRLIEDAFQPDPAAFGLSRLIKEPKPSKPSSQVKFVCTECGAVARAHRDTLLICGVCTPEGKHRKEMIHE